MIKIKTTTALHAAFRLRTPRCSQKNAASSGIARLAWAFFLLVLLSSLAVADVPVEVWRYDQTLFGGAAVDSMGNTVLGSATQTTKIAPDGTVLWTSEFASPAGHTHLQWTAVDSQDHVIRGGYTEVSSYAFLVVKYDRDGQELWHSLATVGFNPEAIRAEVDELDGIYVFGETTPSLGAVRAFLTVKFSPTGGFEWSRIADAGNEPSGLVVRDGQVVAAGFGSGRFVTVSYDYAGNERWRGLYHGNAGAMDVAIGARGQVAVCGWSRIPGTNTNAGTVVQYDSAGVEEWVAYHNSSIGTDIFRKVAIGEDGSVVAVGAGWTAQADDAWSTIKLDTFGALQWARLLDGLPWNSSSGFENARSVTVSPSGSIFVGGPSSRTCPGVGMDGHVAKYTPDGLLEWNYTLATLQNCSAGFPTRILQDPSSGELIAYADFHAFRLREPVGAPYCAATAPNSSGFAALITATGSAIATLGELTLTASQLPPLSFGYFLVSQTQDFVVGPGGSQGNLCLGGTVGRFAQQVQNSGMAGRFSIPVDLRNLPPNPSHSVMSGETWFFQAWFRDGNPGPTSNFSNGVSITYQ